MKLTKKTLAGAGAAVVVLGGVVALPARALTGAAGWVPTATLAEPTSLMTRIGPAPAAAPVRVVVSLRSHDQAGQQAAIRSAAAGSPLSPARWTAAFAPSAGQVAQVASYLRSSGFTGVDAGSDNLVVSATGTVAAAEKAFDTTLAMYSFQGRAYRINTSAAQVPAALAGTVGAVLGLDDVARVSSFAKRSATQPPQSCTGASPGNGLPALLCEFEPQGFWRAYDAGQTPTAAGVEIGILAEGKLDQVVTDLRTEESRNGLPQVPVNIVQVGAASPDTSGSDEWDLDTQYSTGMAGTVKNLDVYDITSLNDSDLTLGIDRAVSQDKARAMSMSLGECSSQAFVDGAMLADDELYSEALGQGQSWFASTGDTGGACPVAATNGVPAGPPDVSYPASSEYVVAVGGTTLMTNDDGSYNREVAWYAGGGGVSAFEAPAYWQVGVPPVPSVPVAVSNGRGLPDLALDADNNTGADVIVGGRPTEVGGTSLSSPLALGVWARVLQADPEAGIAAPALYAVGKQGEAPAYHDVTVGTDVPWVATPGWDYTTGFGSPDVAQLEAQIAKLSGPAAVVALPAGSCRVATAGYKAVHPLGATGPTDSLNIRSVGFRPTPDGKGIIADLAVTSLSGGPGGTPALAGDGDAWYVTWTLGATTYFAEATYPDPSNSTPDPGNPASVLVGYQYGSVTTSPTGGTLYQAAGKTTGVFDTAHNTISVTVPSGAFGAPATGTVLDPTGATTFGEVSTPAGGLLEQADTAIGAAYVLGTSC